MLKSRRSRPIGSGAVTCRHGRAALPDAARPSRRPPRRVRRAVSDSRGRGSPNGSSRSRRSQNCRANTHADAAVRRSPTRRVRRAARRSATRRRAPREVAADAEEADYRRSSRRPKEQKNVFRDGAAGGFEPAPLNRRRPPETTSPPREAGASRSRELPHKQRSDMRRRAQGTRGRSRKRPVGDRSRPCNAGTAVTYVPLEPKAIGRRRLRRRHWGRTQRTSY